MRPRLRPNLTRSRRSPVRWLGASRNLFGKSDTDLKQFGAHLDGVDTANIGGRETIKLHLSILIERKNKWDSGVGGTIVLLAAAMPQIRGQPKPSPPAQGVA